MDKKSIEEIFNASEVIEGNESNSGDEIEIIELPTNQQPPFFVRSRESTITAVLVRAKSGKILGITGDKDIEEGSEVEVIGGSEADCCFCTIL